MTDVAQAQVSAAVERGVAARVLDALEPEELGEPIAMFFSVGISTLITHEPGLRRKQFEAMARVLPPGGVSVVVLARFARVTGMHTPRRQEFGLAEPLEVISWGSWGLLPGKLRRRMPVSLANRVDALAGRCGLGLRRIAVLRKP